MNEFTSTMWKKLGDTGVLGITIEEKYGVSGLEYFQHVLCYGRDKQSISINWFKLWSPL